MSKLSAIYSIEQTISPEIAKMISNNIFTPLTPKAICGHLRTKISAHPSNDSSLLYAQIRKLRLLLGNCLADYIEKHFELRDRLISARYSGSTDESV